MSFVSLGSQGLVYNGDCVADGGLQILSDTFGTLSGGIRTESDPNNLVDISTNVNIIRNGTVYIYI